MWYCHFILKMNTMWLWKDMLPLVMSVARRQEDKNWNWINLSVSNSFCFLTPTLTHNSLHRLDNPSQPLASSCHKFQSPVGFPKIFKNFHSSFFLMGCPISQKATPLPSPSNVSGETSSTTMCWLSFTPASHTPTLLRGFLHTSFDLEAVYWS